MTYDRLVKERKKSLLLLCTIDYMLNEDEHVWEIHMFIAFWHCRVLLLICYQGLTVSCNHSLTAVIVLVVSLVEKRLKWYVCHV